MKYLFTAQTRIFQNRPPQGQGHANPTVLELRRDSRIEDAMAGTLEQYIARIRANVAGKDPLTVMRQTPAKIGEILSSATPERLDHRPAPGKWSIREQLAHLADAEMVIAARIRWAAAEPGIGVVGYDQDKWVALRLRS